MSLLDALLLEGFRDPRDLYLALRPDGQLGSGTIDDPYDGGTRFGPALAATLTCDLGEFVVEGAFPGLVANQAFGLSGITGPAAPWFNHASGFTVKAILDTMNVSGVDVPIRFFASLNIPANPDLPTYPPDVQFTWRTRNKVTHAAVSADVRIRWPVAKVTTTQDHGLVNFDAITIGNISNTKFAGTYPVTGLKSSDPRSFRFLLNFLPNPGELAALPLSCTVTRIIHRFDQVMRAAPTSSVIHLGPGTFETRGTAPAYVSHPSDFNQVYVGFVLRTGQRLLGSGVEVSVLRLVVPGDTYNQTSAIGNHGPSFADYAEVADLTVDCNAPNHQAPYGIFPAPFTCGGVALRGSFMRIRRVRAVNSCVQTLAESFVLYLAEASSTLVPAFNTIEDCIVEQPGENNTHETTLLASVGNAYGSARSPIVRHNYVDCTYVKANGVRYSSEYVAVLNFAPVIGAGNENLFTLTTKRPHGRTLATNVRTNIRLNGVSGANDAFYIDTFEVTAVNPPYGLTCKALVALPSGSPDVTKAYLGVDFHGPAALAGTGCVTEGNALYDCAQGFYSDTGSARDAVVRDNYYSNVLNGVNFDFNPAGGGVSEARAAKSQPNYRSLTRSVDANGKFIATFEIPDDVPSGSSPPLQVSVGDAVAVSGALIGGLPQLATPYNDTSSVVSVSSDKRKFSYEMKSNPPADADPPTDPPILFRLLYQVRRLVFENNVCDLYLYDSNSAIAPRVMSTYGYEEGPPFMFPNSIIRGNNFRLGAGSSPVGTPYLGLRLDTCENVLVESNVIDIPGDNLIHYLHSRNVNAFNNVTPAGNTLPLSEDQGNNLFPKKDTLEDRISDALLLSLL